MPTETPTPRYRCAFVLIYREDVPPGDYRNAIIRAYDDESPSIEGPIIGYYHAEFAFSNEKIPLDGATKTEPAFARVEVRADHDLDDDEELDSESPVATLIGSGSSSANEEAAHRGIWQQAKDHLRELGYKKYGFIDRGIPGAEETSGTRIPWP
jgi:hypothetical protein